MEDVKPNFHWVIHIFDQICDYGPVYGFWSFTYERLNKLLKSYNTNNHGGGEIETTFMRAHIRDSKIRDILRTATQDTEVGLQNAANLLLRTDGDNRGTVAGMAQELDEAAQQGMYVSVWYPSHFAFPINQTGHNCVVHHPLSSSLFLSLKPVY